MSYLGGRVRNGESGAGKLVAGKKNVNAKSGKGYSVLPDEYSMGLMDGRAEVLRAQTLGPRDYQTRQRRGSYGSYDGGQRILEQRIRTGTRSWLYGGRERERVREYV
jgi:hypothetical protein